jgi:hypothetical protein
MSLPLQNSSTKGLFVIGRFRSGTTALWNILRHVSGVTAYYEPCHDSLLEHLQAYTSPDPTHIRVNDYWREYEPILDNLPRYYRKEFGTDRLCLPEDSRHLDLKNYIAFLLASTGDHAVACLKMNRMDLRLPWLRSTFPDVPVVYIYRDPRDQWVSLFRNQSAAEIDDPYLNSGYDLMVWSANLFPYIPRFGSTDIWSSYERHYLIWRISFELAKLYADCMIDFDKELQDEPEIGLRKLLGTLGLDEASTPGLMDLVARTEKGRWTAYHDSEWFSAAEMRCDRYLEETGFLTQIAERRIFSSFQDRLSLNPGEQLAGLIYPLCHVISQCRSVALSNIAQLNASLQHAHAFIQQLENEVQKIKRDLERVSQDAEQELKARDEALLEKDRFISSLQEALLEKDRFISSLQEALLEKDRFIFSLKQEIQDITRSCREQLEARDTAAAKKDDYVRSLEREIQKCVRDAGLEVHARNEAMDEKDRYIRSLEEELKRLKKV